MKNLEKFIPYITLFLCFVTLFRTCGISTQEKKMNQKLEVIETRLDSLSKITITEEKLKYKLETTIMWETLVLEELSDKQKMPINHYKNQK